MSKGKVSREMQAVERRKKERKQLLERMFVKNKNVTEHSLFLQINEEIAKHERNLVHLAYGIKEGEK